MELSVAGFLDLPEVVRARPEVLSGTRLAHLPCDWVHTSEIYEIGPLLQGGEVLLTTGLGLVKRSPEECREYVRSLARAGVSALCIELGRSFPRLPEALRAEARELGFPLVVFHEVVPFLEMAKASFARIRPSGTGERAPVPLASVQLRQGALILDLLRSGSPDAHGPTLTRLAESGFRVRPDEAIQLWCLRPSAGGPALTPAGPVSELFAPPVPGAPSAHIHVPRSYGELVLTVRSAENDADTPASRARHLAEGLGTAGVPPHTLIAGPRVGALAGFPAALAEFQDQLRFVQEMAVRPGLVSHRELSSTVALGRCVREPAVQSLAAAQLGPLLAYERAHGTRLIDTLEAFFEAGLSVTAASGTLGIRRQTLYARLRKVQEVLGSDVLERSASRLALELAITSRSLSPQQPGGRGLRARP
ncbi:PucR family transcriptional regulator [Leucobacter sp. M11]|uniref:PucR family transcriptional regulator n=1 Tax=Leucobacter sp. M11 TaxID=2993565 RepID=UPI002D7FF10C|nr:PucR family transcriptional regulator [Leucobacter sp. M11]MEB4616119.1 PucR family transcriptional regulator [Leucobacter sp. M11]